MQIFSKMDIGMVRSSNQDAYFTGEISDGSVFAVVCDGMGGANAGNIASETAVKVISEYVVKSYRTSMKDEDIEKMLNNAILSANIEIYDLSMKNESLSGMGTTAVVALVRNGVAVIAHVGDSRAYLVSDELTQLTRDHSVVQSLLESGKLTPNEAKVHPKKNVITRALGAEENVIADSDIIEIKSGETLLICTDGLSNFAEPSEILDIFKNNKIEDVAELLVSAANKNGGGDNIAVVTITG
ncbi:MAG: Stp1/IreP family PP2C-type Ser/Thr phosphatase [Oscillospiraceae bacterium]|nr:Stp1/IreP family PP2C-type Ser/Thr phosphatase [Oscillospiraceae bacterium]